MRIHTGLLLVAWIQTTLALVQLTGKITNVPRNYQLVDKEEYVNGENFGLRCSIRLNLLEGSLESQLLVNKNFEFKSRPLKPGKYDLTINSHDFTFLQDRYIIEVNESAILAYDYYLDKKDLGDAKDVTETPLLVKTVTSKQYYEVRLSSLQDMVMNSPLGVISLSRNPVTEIENPIIEQYKIIVIRSGLTILSVWVNWDPNGL